MPYVVILDDVEFDEEAGDFKVGASDYSYEKPELGDGDGSAKIEPDGKPGLLSRFRDKVPSYLKLSDDDKELLRVFLPAMKDAGVRRGVISYDGGNDEGFANLETLTAADGRGIGRDDLLTDEAFLAAVLPFVGKQLAGRPAYLQPKEPPNPRKVVGDYLDYEIPVILASVLLGRGYGTGEYMLYGRAHLDLDAMTITDDPEAPYPNGASL